MKTKKQFKNYLDVFEHGTINDFTDQHLTEVVVYLYATGNAEAWFYGMAWPEGYNYCRNTDYITNNVRMIFEHHKLSFWWACSLLKKQVA